VRIDCSLYGDQMLDLHLCLSASVKVRYVLHTQPTGLYNKILVWVSLYASLSLYLSLLDYPSHLLRLLATIACYPFTSPSFSFSISSTLTLSMAKDRICIANDHSNNNTMNLPPLD
jgi:hypothetical protein